MKIFKQNPENKGRSRHMKNRNYVEVGGSKT